MCRRGLQAYSQPFDSTNMVQFLDYAALGSGDRHVLLFKPNACANNYFRVVSLYYALHTTCTIF